MSIGSPIIDAFGNLGASFSQGVTGALDVQQKQAEVSRRLRQEVREMAAKRLDYTRQQGAAAALNGDDAGAAKYANMVIGLEKDAGLGDGTGASIVGAPIMREKLGPMPLGLDPPKVEVGRDFSNPQTKAAVRGRLGLEPPKPEAFTLNPGESRYSQVPGQATALLATAPFKPAAADPNADLERLKLQAEIQKLLNGMNGNPLEDAERMARIRNIEDQIRDRNKPKEPTPRAPQNPLDVEKKIQDLVYGRFPLDTNEKATGIENEELKYQRLRYANRLRAQNTQPAQRPAVTAPQGDGGTGRWGAQIDAAAARYGIPAPVIRAVMAAESGGNAQARSPVGAIGLMQLMPGTAAGLRVDPFDPAQNIDGGAKYLRQQFDRFGSWPKAIAAYNAGPGAVEKYGGIPPFRETQGYVDRITKRLQAEGFNLGDTPAQQAKQPSGKPRRLSIQGQAAAKSLGLK